MITLTLDTIDADTALGFTCSTACLIATAAKRQFPDTEVICGPSSVTIGQTRYSIPLELRRLVGRWPIFYNRSALRRTELDTIAAVRQQLPQTFELEEAE